jgi:curved DNA-binding protein CbpA
VSVLDPYKVLQVDPDADGEVIAAAYKRLARKHHPDVSPDPDSVERMVEINQAWEMLRDPVRRASIDRARSRTEATSAWVVAADDRARTAAREEAGRAPVWQPQPSPGTWPIPGMQPPNDGHFTAAAQPQQGDPAPARPADQSFTTRQAGTGAAGAPPGKPSGSTITFGRYEGWSLGEIARTDLEYLEWLDRMPIGRTYQAEIDAILRKAGRRLADPDVERPSRGLFRRR